MQKQRYTPTKITPNIKIKQDALRKSRQRLLGSVVLLLIALALLLNVTSKVKPIPINPDVVEIKDKNASAPVANIKINASGTPITASAPIASATIAESATAPVNATPMVVKPAVNNSNESNHGFRAGVVNSDNKIKQVASKVKAEIKKIEEPKQKVKINPADILDNVSVDTSTSDSSIAPVVTKKPQTAQSGTKGKSYIQFAALSSPEKASSFQQTLAGKGISTTIEPIKTAKGTLYRLRAGPFSRPDALSKLQQVSNEGYSGIVTGN